MAFSFQGWKIPSGYLKILHVILGTICVGLVGFYSSSKDALYLENEIFYFMLVSYACLFTSFIFLISYLEEGTVEKVKNSFYEIFYHAFSCISYSSATISLIVVIVNLPPEAKQWGDYAAFIVILVCAVVNSSLYFLNAIIAIKSE